MVNYREVLEPALDPDEAFTWADIEARIADETVQLWADDNAAIITELVDDRIHVWLAGGSLKALLRMRPLIERCAKEWGFVRATINGRPGWARAFKPYGYRLNGPVLEKIL